MRCFLIIGLVSLVMIGFAIAADPTVLKPFLTIPLARTIQSKQTEGWEYSDQERAIHGFPTHYAYDFAADRGTPLYAPCDGWAIASAHYFPLQERKYMDKPIGFGLGEFVQIWNPTNEVYVTCGHLEKPAATIPYYFPAQPLPNGVGWYPTIVNSWHKLLLSQPEEAHKKARWVRRGDLIGYVGDTGCSWGYEEKPQQPRNPNQQSWDETHVHLEVFRRNATGNKSERIDPFGKAGAFPGQQLWLLNLNNQPKCADEK